MSNQPKVDTKEGELDSSDSLTSKKSSRINPYIVLIMTFLLFIGPQILVVIFLSIINLVSPGLEIAETLQSSNRPVSFTFGVYAASEVLTLAAMWLVFKKANIRLDSLGLDKIKTLFWAVPAFFAYLFISASMAKASSLFFTKEVLEKEQDLGFSDATASWEIALAFIALVIIAPIVEELLFRGFLFKQLRKSWPFWISAIVSSLLFGLAHLQINVGIDTFALALVLAFLYEKTSSIVSSIGLHMLKNLIAFTFLFFVDIDSLTSTITGLF